MPPVGGAGSDDLASSDELKVFDDEGEKEEENRAISELNELKSSLITEGEQVCPTLSTDRRIPFRLFLFCFQTLLFYSCLSFNSSLAQLIYESIIDALSSLSSTR